MQTVGFSLHWYNSGEHWLFVVVVDEMAGVAVEVDVWFDITVTVVTTAGWPVVVVVVVVVEVLVVVVVAIF